jgi:hypothetical protein
MRGLVILAALGSVVVGMPAMAQQPTAAQTSAIKQACRGDYQSYCASVPPGGSAALQCLQSNAASLSSPCQQALSALSGGQGAAGQSAAGQGAGNPPAAMCMPPAAAPGAPYQPAPAQMSRRQQMMVLRADCGPDFRRLCYGVQPGGRRAIACLYSHGPQLSQVCRAALQGQ